MLFHGMASVQLTCFLIEHSVDVMAQEDKGWTAVDVVVWVGQGLQGMDPIAWCSIYASHMLSCRMWCRHDGSER